MSTKHSPGRCADAGNSTFRGTTDGERFKYLFVIQSRVLADWHDRYLDADKRSAKREQDIQAFNKALTETMDWGMENIPADQTSVSGKVARQEEQAWLDAALGQLPDREREAMTRRVKQNQSLAEIAEAMGTTADAVGGLIVRATRRLKEMAPTDSESSGG